MTPSVHVRHVKLSTYQNQIQQMAKKTNRGSVSLKAKGINWPRSFLNAKTNVKARLECIVPGQIYVVPNLLSYGICNDMIKEFEANARFELAKQQRTSEFAARVNDRAQYDDEICAENLWRILKPVLLGENHVTYGDYELEDDQTEETELFDKSVGLNRNIRIYRYGAGHYFGQHYDESNVVDGGVTKWTLLVYLTGQDAGEVQGGETLFENDDGTKYSCAPTKGMALLHLHGDDCLLHEGALVKGGFKWILRSDLVYPN